MVAAYLYGAPVHSTRYMLLLSEIALDLLKRVNSRVSTQGFIACDPGSPNPPQFEAAAAALQKHLGSSTSCDLKLTPVDIVYDPDTNKCNILESGRLIATVPYWHVLQSWRAGLFGSYDLPRGR